MIQLTINFKDENNDEFNVEFKYNDTIIEFIYNSIFFMNLFGHEGYINFHRWGISLKRDFL